MSEREPFISNEPLEEARELINRLLDDELSPADTARLERLVCERADVREFYVLHMHMWCNLAPHFTATSAAGGMTRTARGEMLESEASMVLPAQSGDSVDEDDEPEPIELPPLVWPAPAKPSHWPRRLFAMGALAATVLIVTTVALLWPQSVPPVAKGPRTPITPRASEGIWDQPIPVTQPSVAPVPDAPPATTATLASSVRAQWEAPHAALAPGQRLTREPLVLKQGLAEIRFANGVRMIIEGPASLQIASDMRTDLHSGKLVATVPPAASGFAVETASAAVVDLGTEFGVEVDQGGATRVEVFQGKVEANAPAAAATTAPAATTPAFASRQLVAGEAGRVQPGAAAIAEEPAAPLSFVREEEFVVRTAAEAGSEYHRWLAYTYQLRRDPSLALLYTFDEPGDGTDLNVVPNRAAYAAVLAGTSRRPQQFDLPVGYTGGAGQPSWAAGRWPAKGALDFRYDARHGALLPEFPHATNGRLTVAAWVFARHYAYWGAIAKNRGDTRDMLGQFSLGLFENDGTLVGRVQQDDGSEVLVREPKGSPLPLGRWVHVAMVADGTTLRVYRDGTEVASAPCSGPTKAPQPRSLAVGFRAGPDNRPTNANKGEHWDGLIDELAVFHRALRAAEIRNLYEAGRP